MPLMHRTVIMCDMSILACAYRMLLAITAPTPERKYVDVARDPLEACVALHPSGSQHRVPLKDEGLRCNAVQAT